MVLSQMCLLLTCSLIHWCRVTFVYIMLCVHDWVTYKDTHFMLKSLPILIVLDKITEK